MCMYMYIYTIQQVSHVEQYSHFKSHLSLCLRAKSSRQIKQCGCCFLLQRVVSGQRLTHKSTKHPSGPCRHHVLHGLFCIPTFTCIALGSCTINKFSRFFFFFFFFLRNRGYQQSSCRDQQNGLIVSSSNNQPSNVSVEIRVTLKDSIALVARSVSQRSTIGAVQFGAVLVQL
jgi:hypothetical protein